MAKRAVILFSGGLDSTTCLYWAMSEGYKCHALTVSYGQRHEREVRGAKKIAALAGAQFTHLTLKLPWLSVSSLVGGQQALPDVPAKNIGRKGIPSTYVPGRNMMFISLGVSLADSIGAEAVVSGPNALDYSGYPDCRPEFYAPLEKAANMGTRAGAEGDGIKLLTPIIRMTKAEIIRLAVKLDVPLKYTWSCYAGGSKPCGHCDSCKLRAKGFAQAGLPDPAL